MTDKYFPRSEIKKLEVELWNLKVKGTDVLGYNQVLQNWIVVLSDCFLRELIRLEICSVVLPDMIHGSVMASRQKQCRDAIRQNGPQAYATAGDRKEVLEKVGSVAYKLELPQELSRVHNTFHVSDLKKCYADEPLAVLLDGLHFNDKLQFVEEPIEITDHEVKRL
ncbi:hypothetical protein Tco_1577082 [Tanacetum coccineum]